MRHTACTLAERTVSFPIGQLQFFKRIAFADPGAKFCFKSLSKLSRQISGLLDDLDPLSIFRAIFGLDKVTSGSVKLEGQELAGKCAEDILNAGIGLVPEDRKNEGIFPGMAISFNMTLKVLKEFIRGIHVDSAKEREIVDQYFKGLSVKAPGPETAIGSLSGGNQQKVVIGSWLASKPKVLILDEPTRGIDVGSKSEIYTIMNDLAKRGVSIIMVSSELPEILNMSDRVIVMRSGRISGELSKEEATQERIMQYAVNI